MRHRDKQRMDLAELSERSGLSIWQLREMIHAGRLKATKPGGGINSKFFVHNDEAEKLLTPIEAKK